jgi:Glycosyl transferases group 1/Glycosyl transferase family 2
MKKTICLNMIVKDESHIIEETLEKLCQKIDFDYWVICDTGSSDNTPQIIQEFFDKKKIKGELHYDQWKDFGYNRTLALNYAFDKTDYLLVFDADDEIVGNLVLPELTLDGYQLIFDGNELTYDRLLLVNNRKRWKFFGVLHEIIKFLGEKCDIEMIKGDYRVISGRKGNRNKDPHKYLKDASILEKAFIDAIVDNDDISKRYAFYCANSFYDGKNYQKAIEWYKRYLKIGDWDQEKYVACRNIFISYYKLDQIENGMFYLIEAFSYDKERVEWVLPIISYYCKQNKHDMVFHFYNLIKDFYETNYLNFDFSKKLFYGKESGDFLIPFYIIQSSVTLQKLDIGIKMYEIIFTKKYKIIDTKMVKILLHNLQFIIKNIPPEKKNFFDLFEEYIKFLEKNNYPMSEYMEYIINYRNYYQNNPKKPNILFLTGFLEKKWNHTYNCKNALGGSESSVAYLSESLSQDYNVYIVGDVEEEIENNVFYVNNSNLQNLINSVSFKVTIISRFLIYLNIVPKLKSTKIYLWAHDFEFNSSGTDMTPEQLLQKWNHKFDGCICLTNWQKNLFEKKYPELKNKIFSINNGIKTELFKDIKKNKIKNQFIYTSRSERGLVRLLELWDGLTEKIPNAKLVISSYNDFPNKDPRIKDIDQNIIQKIIELNKKHNNIKHYGKLNKKELYELMSESEYWFYPCTYPETSCITAMEMLMSEVICICYPFAGLVNTLGDYGLYIDPSKVNEIDIIQDLCKEENNELRRNVKERGKQYALSCSWENRKLEWKKLIKSETKICILMLYSKDEYYDKMKKMSEYHYKNYEKYDNIDYYYITLDPDLEQEYIIKDHDLIIKGTESYIPGILDKTLFALNLFKNKYNYFVRSNISTIIDVDNLTNYLNTNHVDYGGYIHQLNWEDKKFNITGTEYLGTVFVEGTSITLSNNCVNNILNNKEKIPNIIDDVAIGHFFNKNNIMPSYINTVINTSTKKEKAIFYRNKASYNPEFVNNDILKENVLINMLNVINELKIKEDQLWYIDPNANLDQSSEIVSNEVKKIIKT